MNPETLREWAGTEPVLPSDEYIVIERTKLLAAADAWEEERKSYEVLRSGIRSLWHGVVDGDMDRLSVGYALKELFR